MCDSLSTSRYTGMPKTWKKLKYDNLMRGDDDELQGVILRAGRNSKPMKLVRGRMLEDLENFESKRFRSAKEIYDMIKGHIDAVNPQLYDDDPSDPGRFCFMVCGFINKEPFIFNAGHRVPGLDSGFQLVPFTCAGSGAQYTKQIFDVAKESPEIEMVEVGSFLVPKFSSKDKVFLWAKKMMTAASISDPGRTGGTLNLLHFSSNTSMSKDTALLDCLVDCNPTVHAIVSGIWREPTEEDVKKWELLDADRP
ncbi:unnamed protein product [Cuscuta campestris]|uniref:Uncharacterized protein n=1 Tax=Cuscuta campestris TaxID=132261 RepID=A0A484MFT6_9ASTE|nr:unnamed protein product [Cuscuta campestris]